MEQSTNDMNQINITPDEVRRYLLKLRTNKAAGTDNLSPQLSREIVEETPEPLSLIFRRSIEEGMVREDWKTANVTPVFKRGQRQSSKLQTS